MKKAYIGIFIILATVIVGVLIMDQQEHRTDNDSAERTDLPDEDSPEDDGNDGSNPDTNQETVRPEAEESPPPPPNT